MSFGPSKARVSCQTLFVENGKEMLLSDLQTVSFWALKNATLIADTRTTEASLSEWQSAGTEVFADPGRDFDYVTMFSHPISKVNVMEKHLEVVSLEKKRKTT